jgi:polysaccharide biosynthesis protein PslE
MSDEKPLTDYQEIVGKLWRAKWKLLLFQLLVLAGCAGIILFWPRSYLSEGKIYLQMGKESVSLDPTASSSNNKINVQSSTREDEIVTALDLLQSRVVAAKVVESLTTDVVLGNEPVGAANRDSQLFDEMMGKLKGVIDVVKQIDPMPDKERAIISVEKNLKVSAERKSEMIGVKFEAETPQLAQLIVNKLLEVYKDEHMRVHRTDGSRKFFKDQQSLLASELEEANEKLRKTKNRMGLASINGQRTLLEDRNRETQLSMADAERSKYAVEASIRRINEDLKRTPERINSTEVSKSNSATDMQSQQLYTLQLQLTEYENKYKPGHPKLEGLRKQVQDAEEKYRKKEVKSQEVTDDINPIHRALTLDLLKAEAERAGINAKIDNLVKQRDEVIERLRELNQFDKEITDLERERGVREAKYISYTNSLEEARLNTELDASRISSVVIAQEATLQERPVSPSKLLVILCGAGLILAGTCFLSFLLVKLDDRMTTPDAVRNRTGLPVLCTLPKAKQLVKV